MPLTAVRLENQKDQNGNQAERTELALSIASQITGGVAEKQKTCEFLMKLVEWVGNDADSKAKRNALALAAQMPGELAAAIAAAGIASSIILALFGVGEAG